MNEIDGHTLTQTRLCRIPNCPAEAVTGTHGRWANLCAEHKQIEVKKAADARGNGHAADPPKVKPAEELAEEGFENKARGLVNVGRRLDRAIKTYRPAKDELDQAIEGWRAICRELAGDDPRP